MNTMSYPAADQPDTTQAWNQAGSTLNQLLEKARDIGPVYLHLVLSDAAAYHAQTLARRPHDYTPNVRLRLEMARYVLAEDYIRALRGKSVITGEVDRALAGVDALVLPALAVPAPIHAGGGTAAVAHEPHLR